MSDDAIAAARELFELDPQRVACPYPTFAGLQRHAPVTWFDVPESYVVTDYDLILEILRRPDLFSSRSPTGPATDREMVTLMMELAMEDPEMAELAGKVASGSAAVLLQADPPDHPRQRKLVNRAFSPGAIAKIEPDIEAVTQQLISEFHDRGRMELIEELSIPLPMTVIAKAIGISLDRMDDFMAWSKTLVAGIGKRGFDKKDLRDILITRQALGSYLHSVVLEREAAPQDDLISTITHATIDGERLSHNEVVNMVVQFLLAGNDTTAKLIGASMLFLAQHPEVADRLRAHPETIEAFVEEMLRLNPPINGTYRIADIDHELGGVKIPAGSSMFLVYAAGNRQPEHFPEPDELHCPQESKSPHLAFGFGAHFCLGASLARAESRIAIRSLLERCADIQLDVPADEVEFDPSFMLHSLKRLPLKFIPQG